MKNTDLGLLILRWTLGILMLLHGISKVLSGVSGIGQMMEEAGLPEALAYGVYFGEVLAPLMLIVGWRTRFGALLYVVTMLVAIYLAHASDIGRLSPSGGWAIELQALYLLGALALFFTGGGRYAVSTTSRWD